MNTFSQLTHLLGWASVINIGFLLFATILLVAVKPVIANDWAAKGPLLLGVKAVIAETYERIHRSNLIGMGILPLQFKDGEGAQTYELEGTEQFSIQAVKAGQKQVQVDVQKSDGSRVSFDTDIRIDTPNEFEYFRHGGILQYVIRSLL